MSAYRSPRKGSRVRLVFEGVVRDTDLYNVRFEHPAVPWGVTVTWGANNLPSVLVLDQGFEVGDIGVLHNPSGGSSGTVVFSKGSWCFPSGVRAAHRNSPYVTHIVNADGSLVEQPEQPEEFPAPSVPERSDPPQPGDVGIYTGSSRVCAVVFRRDSFADVEGWYDVQTHSGFKVASAFSPEVRLVVRDGVVQEGS
jgi:hypothetical protein